MIFLKKILKKSNFISFQLQFLSQFVYLFLENSPNFSVIAALFLCLFPMIPSGLSTKLDNNSFNASHGTKLSVHWQSFRNTKSSREQTWISVWSALTFWRVFSIKGTQKLINVNLFRRSAETGIGLWLGTYRLQFWVLTRKNRRLFTLHKTFRNSRQICFRLNRSADERFKPAILMIISEFCAYF